MRLASVLTTSRRRQSTSNTMETLPTDGISVTRIRRPRMMRSTTPRRKGACNRLHVKAADRLRAYKRIMTTTIGRSMYGGFVAAVTRSIT